MQEKDREKDNKNRCSKRNVYRERDIKKGREFESETREKDRER